MFKPFRELLSISIIGIAINYPFCCSGAISPILGLAVISNQTRSRHKRDNLVSHWHYLGAYLYFVGIVFLATNSNTFANYGVSAELKVA